MNIIAIAILFIIVPILLDSARTDYRRYRSTRPVVKTVFTQSEMVRMQWQAVLNEPDIWFCPDTRLYHYADETQQLSEQGYATLSDCRDSLHEYGWRLSAIPSYSCPACMAKRNHSEYEKDVFHKEAHSG